MCDYSLHHVTSRPAVVADKIVTSIFPGTITRGFAEEGGHGDAVCLLPGTEIAFADPVQYYEEETHFVKRKPGKVARFRQVDLDNPYRHHDALEFPDGQVVLVTRLCQGQHATVLQLPAEPVVAKAEPVPERAYREAVDALNRTTDREIDAALSGAGKAVAVQQ